MSTVIDKLHQLLEQAWNAKDAGVYDAWVGRTAIILKHIVGQDALDEFYEVAPDTLTWPSRREYQTAVLEAFIVLEERAEDFASAHESDGKAASRPTGTPPHPKRVFVVHGHDNTAKESVARFLERLDLEPVVLHEQPNAGLTIIEKLEQHAAARFAIVLLTPDDIGAAAASPHNMRGRARQNVILELGFFMGRLTRRRVCALYKPGVEIPSDYQGVAFTELDEAGGWRTKVAQELVEAGFSINLEALLKS